MERFYGIIVGAATFLIIGIFHPLVIKAEYRWGKKCWVWFLLAGIALSAASILTEPMVLSIIFAVAGFSCFWSIREVMQQEKRVLRGWFPENPSRHDYYEAARRKPSRKD